MQYKLNISHTIIDKALKIFKTCYPVFSVNCLHVVPRVSFGHDTMDTEFKYFFMFQVQLNRTKQKVPKRRSDAQRTGKVRLELMKTVSPWENRIKRRGRMPSWPGSWSSLAGNPRHSPSSWSRMGPSWSSRIFFNRYMCNFARKFFIFCEFRSYFTLLIALNEFE